MLKIHNNNFKQYRIPLISAFAVIGGMFLFSYLTYIPTQTFAVDGSEEQRTLMNIKYMQQMSEQICTNTKENKTKQLIDKRDGKEYWVTKLKDGNCWMTQNLAYNGGGQPRIYNNVDKCLDWTNDNTQAQYCDLADNSAGHNSYGNYYSWPAAMDGNILATGKVQGVCSQNWHLPTGGPSGNFAKLAELYNVADNENGVNILLADPLYFVYSGGVHANNTHGAGQHGFYWSSTAGPTDAAAYNLRFLDRGGGTYNVYVNDHYDRYRGFTVRCLVDGIGTNGNGNTDESVWPDPDFPDPLDSNQANVAITVSPVISIDATSGMSESIDFTQVAEGNITAKVSSNQAYQVLLSTEQSNLEQNPVLANFNIPMVANDTEIIAGVNSWGVKKTLSVAAGGTAGDDTTLINALYSPIGIGDDKVLFYKSSGAESKTLVFPVAISVDATLPSGIYSTQVTITAVAN